MTDVKVSIITVCYNSVKTIEQTIISVINQSYDNIEYIIIDGGSTDGTIDIIRKYEKHIAYWVSEPDNGIYDAMNKGIKASSGDLISFLNSDDWYADNIIRCFVDRFISSNVDVLYGDLTIVDNSGHELEKRSYCKVDFDYICYEMILAHPTMFVRSNILRNRLFSLDYKIASDYDLLCFLVLKNYSFSYVECGTVAYFRYGGVSNVNNSLCRKETNAVSRKTIREFNPKVKDVVKKQLYQRRLLIIAEQILLGANDLLKQRLVSELDKREIKTLVIWGGGEVGSMLANSFLLAGVDFIIVDMDPQKQGRLINDRKIYPPSIIKTIEKKLVVIANLKYSEDISLYLKKSGEPDDVFFTFEQWAKILIKLKYFYTR